MHKTGSKNLQSCLKQRWQCQCGVARADHDQEEHDAAGEVDGSEGGGREVGGWEGGRWLVRTSIKLSAGGASATQSKVSSTLQHSLQCTLGNIVKIVNNRCCRVLFELHNRTMHYAVLQSIAENIFICDGKQVG